MVNVCALPVVGWMILPQCVSAQLMVTNVQARYESSTMTADSYLQANVVNDPSGAVSIRLTGDGSLSNAAFFGAIIPQVEVTFAVGDQPLMLSDFSMMIDAAAGIDAGLIDHERVT